MNKVCREFLFVGNFQIANTSIKRTQAHPKVKF